MEFYNQQFTQTDDLPTQWELVTFEACTFKKLDFSSQNLSGASFVDCRFEGCNLGRVTVKKTKLYDVTFADCQLVNVDFGQCDPFGFHVDFQNCQLDYTVFVDRKLKKATFRTCSIREAFFVKCDLTGTVFDHCNLELTKFDGNDLTQVDFSSSYNLELNPDENKIKKTRVSLYNLPGLLKQYDLVITS